MNGIVAAFDDAAGLGEIDAGDGRRIPFHCVAIADGSRTIAVGTAVEYELLPKLGRHEATAIPPTMTDPDRERRILDVIRALAPGEVVTYGDIAEDAGYPKQSRLVGHILATTTEEVPWWRVVNSAGRLVPGHERTQAALLRVERVRVAGGRVAQAPLGRFRP